MDESKLQEPWKSSYSVRRGEVDGIKYVYVTVDAKEFILYEHEAEYLLNLLNQSLKEPK